MMGLTTSKGSAPSASVAYYAGLPTPLSLPQQLESLGIFESHVYIWDGSNSSACIRSTQISTSVRICKEMDRSNLLRKRYSPH